jgi:hypothetical protein
MASQEGFAMRTFVSVVCGIVLSAVILIGGCALIVGGCTTAVVRSEAERQKERTATNQRIITGSTSPAAEEKIADATESVQQGDAVLRVIGLQIDFVPVKSFSGDAKSKEERLMISLELANSSTTKIMRYRGWGAQWSDFDGRDRASLKDDMGNSYKSVYFGAGAQVVGQVSDEASIYPQKSLTDVLVFEPPIECQYLVLALPASAVGGKGMFRLRIPRDMWATTETILGSSSQ